MYLQGLTKAAQLKDYSDVVPIVTGAGSQDGSAQGEYGCTRSN